MESASSMHVRFLNDEMAFRITFRVDGHALWNSALTPFKGTNTLSPFVTLPRPVIKGRLAQTSRPFQQILSSGEFQ
jgi:hypothetical protein